MASVKIKDKVVLEADVVYLLMKKGFPISRNVRAQWMLEHLDTTITTQSKNVKNKEAEELEIVSVLPKNKPESWTEEISDRFAYKVTSKTTIIFLAHKYRMVFNLDLSPSLATVDIQHGEIVIDEVYTATKNFLENIIKPFTLPGCKRVFQPEIYVTIIAHTPFFTSPAQQVLVQGWLVTMDNVDQLTVYIKQQLHLLEEKVAFVTSVANQQIESLRAENERLVGGLFEENVCSNRVTTTPIISPESSFVNILRYGMLALSLLPEYSCAHMVIVTDGILGNPDGPVLDSLMQQLRATTIACSFLHVGSTYHPHCGDGLVPYQDLLHFVARATLGVCMSYIPYPTKQTGTEMNVYQKNFLRWMLYREPDNSNHNYDNNSNINWTLSNTLFYEQKSTQLLQKKQIEDKVTCTLSSLLCCRLREGYLIKYANIKDEVLEIKFVLLWKSSVLLEYDISCPWTTKSLSASSCIQYTISIEAPYEFLHDITCLSKKPLKSHYRQGVVNRFWATLTSLTESDSMLAHFSWFPEFGWTWYSVPDTIRSGMPVFYLSAYPSPSTVQLSDAACPQFAQIYQPVVSLSSTHWSRYMHTQRLTLLLSHDRPLPRHLQLTNQSGRFQSIQSRQSFAVLSAMLKNWSTFVLVENHTYVQFIYREIDKPPVSFSLIRINSKNLVVVLNIAFAAGTEGAVRHNVVGDLLERLAKLSLPNRNTEKETPSCVIIKKSLEKILIRYERIPKDFTVVNFPDEYNKLNSGGITASLSRYLYHNRWLWHVKRPFVQSIPGIVLPRLNVTAIARILSTITKMRLAEGFNFTYSASGILNMVLEVQMCGVKQNDECYPCIIQYVLFPPYVTSNAISERDSASEEDTDEGTEVSMEDAENFGDFQIISEIWIEPQYGFAKLYPQGAAGYMNRLQYHEIPEAISRLDEDCVNALLTLEYLCLLSQLAPNEKSTEIVYGQAPHYNKYKKSNKNVKNSNNNNNCNIEDSCVGVGNLEERINVRNFVFDALNILPKCQQAELLYSMFNDGNNDENLGSANKILMDNYLECIKQLHNKELLLTSAESQRFTKLLLEKRRAGGLPSKENYPNLDHASDCPRWKCFIKGITASHVIITILPASDKDARLFINKLASNKGVQPKCEEEESLKTSEERLKNVEKCSKDEEHLVNKTEGEEHSVNKIEKYSNSDEYSMVNNENSETVNTNLQERSNNSIGELNKVDKNDNDCEESKLFDLCNNSPIIRESSRMIKTDSDSQSSTIDSSDDSKCSRNDLKNNEDSLMIPVYVYDCSLSFLIDTFVDKLKVTRNKDIYQDNRFRIEGKDHGDIVELRECGGIGSKPVTPEPRSEDSDNTSNEQKSLMEHLKQLSLSHCHCFVVAVYTSLVLNEPLTYDDMESAIEQCEESLIEINITSYLRSVCKHLNKLEDEDRLRKSGTKDCDGVKQLHELVKEKFERIIGVAFRPVPAHPEFYYCAPSKTENDTELGEMQKSDSDDDLENLIFDGNINRKGNPSWPPLNTDFQTKTSQPLFLQLSCSIRLKNRSLLTTVPVKNLPTCFFEILEKLENQEAEKDDILNSKLSDLKVTLDIICLNLPKEVSEKYLEDNGKNDIFDKEGKMNYLNSGQNNVINNLKEDIEWILKDETATALLDKNIVDDDILKFVINHVFESTDKFSCKFEKVPLNFVFSSEESKPKFINELKKLEICEYCLKERGNFYFLEKVRNNSTSFEKSELKSDLVESMPDQGRVRDGKHSRKIDFYDSDFKDGCSWLVELEKRENSLPNFWLILSVENDFVNVYFHCRFLEIDSPEVLTYIQTQNTLITQIKSICRRVNQYLLLQNLHKTSKCSELLESEDHNSMEDYNWRTEARKETLSVLKNKEGTQNFTPGMFQCRVVWKFTFRLHPRLKTGPGRSGLSRGIKALHGVLNRFAVTNRSNMFVYQENNKNVFYLRLHEQISNNKSLQSNLSDDSEQVLVSRSNSVVSLSQTTLGNNNSSDTRPRVRSFSEKQSNVLNKDSEDSIVLMVHGISEAGPEVKHDLVQVLQNRLDDAVLEVLSVMLARNPMCKLTPADVRFVQPPTQPESIIELTIGEHCLPYISALEFYLKQNILQFLYIPKYTDTRIECHFRDHSELDNENIFLYNQSHSSGNKGIAVIALTTVSKQVTDCSSASKTSDSVVDLNSPMPGNTSFLDMDLEDFEQIVSTSISEKSCKNSDGSIKFKIWKQGKVNLESLSRKLVLAVEHSVWDLVTEYKFLAAPFSEKINHHVEEDKAKSGKESTEESEEKAIGTEKSVKSEQSSIRDKKKLTRNEERSAKHDKKLLKTGGSKKGEEKHGKDEENRKEEEQSTKNEDTKNEEKQSAAKAETIEAEGGEKLSDIYCSTLPKWFRFALDIRVPSVKKHEVVIDPRHAIGTIIVELENIIQSQSTNISFKAFVLKSRQPFVEKFELDERTTVSEYDGRFKSKKKTEVPTYIPWDYKKDMQGVFTKCILIARNFEQRKASFSNETESSVPKDQKLLQKFNPLILDSNFVKEGFLSRQGILIAEVQSDKVTLYMYHWSKEKSEKIIKQTTSLGSWLSSRSNFFTNVTMQKLGIFSHRPSHKNGPQVMEMEGLTKFEKVGKDWNKGKVQGINMKYSWNEVIGNAMRDVKCSDNSYHNSHHGNVDPIAKAVNELQELRNKEKKVKDDLNKLCAMWPDRNVAPNIPISTAALTTFKQYSRLIHFCHTPLLFLPSWRLQSAATRDHSLTTAAEQSTLNNCHQEKTKGQDEPDEKWHRELCESMLKEYREYLHLLGFCSVDVEVKNSEGQEQQQSYYLKKSMLGGVLLFEIQLSQPFFIAKLNIIECSRLQTKTSSALVNQFMLSFVDACDKIKINMHLHSFTYDFHLRCIHSYIARSVLMEQGYHLINFLDDFNKYYSKAPNYARNLIYSDTITIPNLPISGRTLYSYLLSHYNLYNMVALEMRQPCHDPEATEHVLINLNRLPLIDSPDSQESRPESNDFEVVLIVSLLSQIEKMEIGLKYYLILTSKREVYPKRDMENYSTLGKFQTVHNVEKSKNSSKEITAESPSIQEPKPNANDSKLQTVNSTAPVPPPVPNSLFSRNLSVSKNTETSSIQIRQESINYLGYYSSHEQSMQRTIALKANEARSSIIKMINKGALQCRTHLLWNKLLDSKSTMSYGEFTELCELAKVEPLSSIDVRLKTFLNQPIAWYQALMKVLQNKYQENHKIFNTPDGNVTHLLVLHPSYYQVFMMLTIDLHATRGDLYAVYRKSEEVINATYCVEDTYSLIEGFVNACCFHLWMNLYS